MLNGNVDGIMKGSLFGYKDFHVIKTVHFLKLQLVQNLQVLDYIFSTDVLFSISKPKPKDSFYTILRPFGTEVWITVLFVACTSAATIGYLNIRSLRKQ